MNSFHISVCDFLNNNTICLMNFLIASPKETENYDYELYKISETPFNYSQYAFLYFIF